MERKRNRCFPTLEKNGMPKDGGPIARMLYEHEITKDLANSIIKATKNYISSGDNAELVKSIDEYVHHVSLHLAKENQRLFVMADVILKDQENAVNNDLGSIENAKLDETGNSREYYEKLLERMNLQK